MFYLRSHSARYCHSVLRGLVAWQRTAPGVGSWSQLAALFAHCLFCCLPACQTLTRERGRQVTGKYEWHCGMIQGEYCCQLSLAYFKQALMRPMVTLDYMAPVLHSPSLHIHSSPCSHGPCAPSLPHPYTHSSPCSHTVKSNELFISYPQM